MIDETKIKLGSCQLIQLDWNKQKITKSDVDIDRFISTLDHLHKVTHVILNAMEKAKAHNKIIDDMYEIHDKIVDQFDKYCSIPRGDQL